MPGLRELSNIVYMLEKTNTFPMNFHTQTNEFRDVIAQMLSEKIHIRYSHLQFSCSDVSCSERTQKLVGEYEI